MTKIKILIFGLFLLITISLIAFPIYASTNVNTFQVTATSQTEKWNTIYKNNIYWLDSSGIIKGFNTKKNVEFNLLDSEQPLEDIFAIVAYDGRYVVYNRYDNISYNVSVYDTKDKQVINVAEGEGSRWATDYDNKTIVYVDGGACGKLYSYNLQKKVNKLISETVCGNARISKNKIVWGGPASGGYGIWTFNTKNEKTYEVKAGSGHTSSPDINDNNVIWTIKNNETTEVHIKNINKEEEKIIYETSNYDISWPSLSDKYAVWGKVTGQHVSGIEGINLKTGEVFEIQEQGPHQNGNIQPIIEENLVAWMAWRTGNGDIYGSILHK